jgi:hypothetical protein
MPRPCAAASAEATCDPTRAASDGHRPLLAQGLGQSLRRHQLHDQDGLALVLDRIEDRDDMRVVEPGVDPCLAHRTLGDDPDLLLAQARMDAQLLDRDIAVKELVPGLPDHAHPARAQLPD